ncbi:MAG: Gfo/Idh/MocA family protein [Limisphaerales bacterium]
MNRRSFLARSAVALAATPLALADDAAAPLRAAVIGHTGRGDYGHAMDAVFRGRPGVELLAVADPHPEGRASAAKRIGAPRSYADYREMLERERPQVVSIAMRHADQHAEIGLACLRAGAHVYLEKPIARTPAEADALIAEARRNRLKVAVAHTMRMMPQVVNLRTAVADGLIGDLRELRAWGKQDQRAGGEDMMVLGTHLFDLMRMFAGNPESVSARVLDHGRLITRADRRQVKDNVGWLAGDQVSAAIQFGDGVQGTFTSDGRLRETVGHWGLELVGSRGAARINCDLAPNVFVRSSTGWSSAGRADTWRPLDPSLAKSPPDHQLAPVADWLAAVRNDTEPECSALNAAWAVEMVMAVYTSSLTGSRVTIPLPDRTHPLGG